MPSFQPIKFFFAAPSRRIILPELESSTTLPHGIQPAITVSCCDDDAADYIHKHLNPCGDESQCIGVVMAISSSHRQLPPLFDSISNVGSS